MRKPLTTFANPVEWEDQEFYGVASDAIYNPTSKPPPKTGEALVKVQTGVWRGTGNGGTDYAIILPKAFPGGVYSVVTTNVIGAAGGLRVDVLTVYLDYFTVRFGGAIANGTGFTVCYVAYGW